MSSIAQLVMPAVRWDAERGFEPARQAVEEALELGAGGFILFGGERDAVGAFTRSLRSGAKQPLLIASDLERGAGQQVRGLTSLPPLLALARMGEPVVRDAAALTALEAQSVGIDWVFAPDLDLDVEPANPIVQTRSLGDDPAVVAALGTAWIEACQGQGVLACAKHFPGHGRTTTDSHAALPVVRSARSELEDDLVPFAAAVAAGVASVMTAHVAYPALDSLSTPATFSRPIITGVLREELGFEGLVVTDALIMEGAKAGAGGGASEAEGAVRALAAGCDLLLYPSEPRAVVQALERAVASGELSAGRLEQSLARRHALLGRREVAALAPVPEQPLRELAARMEASCERAVVPLRGEVRPLSGAVHVEIVDDDAGGPYALPSRNVLAKALWAAGVELRPDGERLVLLFADVKSWKGRAALSDVSRQRLAHLLEKPATVVLLGHPRRLAEIPGRAPVLCAWSGDEAMQRAAARRLSRG